jgi:hypothetical protein
VAAVACGGQNPVVEDRCECTATSCDTHPNNASISTPVSASLQQSSFLASQDHFVVSFLALFADEAQVPQLHMLVELHRKNA